jgi:hypothetical protein
MATLETMPPNAESPDWAKFRHLDKLSSKKWLNIGADFFVCSIILNIFKSCHSKYFGFIITQPLCSRNNFPYFGKFW